MNSYLAFPTLAAFFVVAFAGAAPAQHSMDTTMTDMEVVRKLATINLNEIELGKLAVQNGTSGFGRSYGQRMIDDHEKAQIQLQAIAVRMGVSMPKSMDDKHQAMWTHLSRLSGPAFDKAYCRDMINGHRIVYGKSSKWEDQVSDPALKSYITEHMPVTKKHQILAREVWNQKAW